MSRRTGGATGPTEPRRDRRRGPPVRAALDRLREGNRRFVRGEPSPDGVPHGTKRPELPTDHEPVAVVLACSDARVPVETVFDQGPGDLFVIRVAGNVVTPTQLGSVEFAAEYLGVRLVVVLGHTGCGAVEATLEALENPGVETPGSLRSIIDRIRPSVQRALAGGSGSDRDALTRRAVRLNVRASVEALRHGSEILEPLVADHGLRVLGAEYSMETGVVEFLDALSGPTESERSSTVRSTEA